MATTWLTLAALVGIILLTPTLLELRLYLGRRAAGSGPILIDGYLMAQVVLLATFAFFAARLAGWNPGEPWLTWLRVGLGLSFAVKPWITWLRLTRWKTRTPAGQREEEWRPPRAGGIP